MKKDTEKMALHIVRKGFDSREVLFQHSWWATGNCARELLPGILR